MDKGLATEIWNRAATVGGGLTPQRGDMALSSALAFHNMVMSGGVDHAFNILPIDQIAAAANGYRFFCLEAIADLIGHAPTVLRTEDDDAIEQLTHEYNELVPLDHTIVERVDAALQRSPQNFAPV